jgi:aminoglycoside phosphotransferase (APT) family kinase protein
MARPNQMRDPELIRHALEGWLIEKMRSARDVAITEFSLPPAGYSNETAMFDVSYVEDGESHVRPLVARWKSGGYELFYDCELFLQSQMMEAIAAVSDVRVPEVIFTEPDPDVIGCPFFVMSKAEGRVPPDLPSYHRVGWVTELSPADRRRMYCNGLDAMATINRLDPRQGFDFLDESRRGRPGLDRHLTWVEDWMQWARNGRPNPILDAALAYLRRRQPADGDLAVLWGDARVGNMVFGDDLSVSGVLDWELAAAGPAEIDLGWWLMMDWYWSEGVGAKPLDGIPDRSETLTRYETLLGRPLGDLDYYEILGFVRFAICMVRGATLAIDAGRLPERTTMDAANPVTQWLARTLDLPVPEVSPDLQAQLDANAGDA